METYLGRLGRQLSILRSKLLIADAALVRYMVDMPAPVASHEILDGFSASGPLPAVRGEASELCNLQLTSGSTGVPRAVEITHDNVLEHFRGTNASLCGKPGRDVFFSWLPLHHDMGLQGGMLYPMLARLPVYLMSPWQFVRRPLLWLEGMHTFRATMTVAPHFSYALVAHMIATRGVSHELALDCVRVALNGSEPIEPLGLRRFHAATAPYGLSTTAMGPCYGLGEATLAATLPDHRAVEESTIESLDAHSLRDGRAEPSSGRESVEMVASGRPLDNVDVLIIGDDGRPRSERRVGEIAVRGPAVCRGYFEDPEATKKSFRDGCFHTGDLGYVADGRLFVVGRSKDIIVVRGQKYAPHELEWAAEHVTGVCRGRAAAFGVADDSIGTQRPIVVCESKLPAGDYQDLSKTVHARVMDEVGLHCEIVVVPPKTVPKTSSGKVMRHRVKQHYLRS